jgi:hypothetical protein
MEPYGLDADWVFAGRNDPKPIPISYHHGVVVMSAEAGIQKLKFPGFRLACLRSLAGTTDWSELPY